MLVADCHLEAQLGLLTFLCVSWLLTTQLLGSKRQEEEATGLMKGYASSSMASLSPHFIGQNSHNILPDSRG